MHVTLQFESRIFAAVLVKVENVSVPLANTSLDIPSFVPRSLFPACVLGGENLTKSGLGTRLIVSHSYRPITCHAALHKFQLYAPAVLQLQL